MMPSMVSRVLTFAMVFAGCSPTPAQTPLATAPPMPSAPATVPPAPRAALEPPPPAGVVVPRGVRPIEVAAASSGSSYLWRATFAGDPTDSELLARVSAARERGENLAVAQAALLRYQEDVVAAGFQIVAFAFMPGFDYPVTAPTGALSVFVRVPSNDPHGNREAADDAKRDDAGPYFEIVVGMAGG